MIRKKISRRTFLAALPAAALVLAGCSSGKRGGTSESTLISRNETASASKVDTAAPSIASRKVLLVNYPSHSTLKLLDPDGTEICSLESCDFSVPVCKDGKFPIRKKEKFGYADIDGNLLLKPIYDYPPSYVDGFFTAVKNGMTGYADADGAFFLSPQYSDAGVFSHGFAPVKQDDLWGFIDRSGEFVIPPQFESKPSSFSANFASCSIKKQSGIIDQNGNWTASNFTPFYSTLPFYDGYVVALSTESKQFCYVDMSGKVSIDGPFSAAGDFCEERAVVEEDNAFGFIDTNGNYIFKPQADVIANYHDGFAFVRTPDFTGFLDKKGKKAISFQDAVDTFSYIESDLFSRRQVAFLRFENGYAFVPFENASSKLFDTKGKVVFDFSDIEKKYGSVHYAYKGDESFAITSNDEGRNLIDFNGNVLSSLGFCDFVAILDPSEEHVHLVLC